MDSGAERALASCAQPLLRSSSPDIDTSDAYPLPARSARLGSILVRARAFSLSNPSRFDRAPRAVSQKRAQFALLARHYVAFRRQRERQRDAQIARASA